jgi:leucyl aminopeptidase
LTWHHRCGDNRGRERPLRKSKIPDLSLPNAGENPHHRRTPIVTALECSIKQSAPEKVQAACVVVGVYEPRKLSAAAQSLDRASRGVIRALLAAGDMDGKNGTSRLLYRVPGVTAERVLLVGLERARPKEYREAVRAAAGVLVDTGAAMPASIRAEEPVSVKARKARHLVLAACDALYRFEEMSKKGECKMLARLALGVASRGAQTNDSGPCGGKQCGGE